MSPSWKVGCQSGVRGDRAASRAGIEILLQGQLGATVRACGLLGIALSV